MSLASRTKDFFSRTTARTTGWVDMFKTIGALLVLAAAITGLAWASGFVVMSLASALTVYVATLLVVSAIATFNYIFAAQFTRFSLSAFPAGDQAYGAPGKEMPIKSMVRELITLANKKDPKNNKTKLRSDLWVGMFNEDHSTKLVSVYGINKKAAAIFIPSGTFMAHTGRRLTEKEFAALLMVEVIKIRNAHARRGFFHTIGNIGLTFASLIEDLDHSSWFLGRLIATIGSPFQLVLLFQKSRNRTYHYEAMEQLIAECGVDFGIALQKAYIKLGLPWQNPEKPVLTDKDLPLPSDGLKDDLYNDAAQTVFTTLKGNKEAFSDMPSAGNIQEFLAKKLKESRPLTTPRLNPALEAFFNKLEEERRPISTVDQTPTHASNVPPVSSVATAALSPTAAPITVAAPVVNNSALAANDQPLEASQIEPRTLNFNSVK